MRASDPKRAGEDETPHANSIRAYSELLELHSGRHSTVWSARVAAEYNKVVVIKGYSKLRLKPRQLRNVTRELHLLRLFHKTKWKGVVQLLSSFEESEIVYLIFEACMHGDLYQLLLRHKRSLTEEFVVAQIVVPLLSALAHLHKLGVVHRDIKPENIFIGNHGEVLLGDFGLAAHLQHDNLTERVGTLDYMAPEVLAMPTPDEMAKRTSNPRRPHTEKVDVWAVGILVYEMLCGAPPFEVEDPKETARLIMKSHVRNFPAGMSEECKDFIALALEKNPKKRPGAKELMQHPWILGHVDGVTPAPICPDLAQRALKRIIHASWTSMTLEALMDTAVPPVRADAQLILKACSLSHQGSNEERSIEVTGRTSSFTSRHHSLSSVDELVFDSDGNDDEDDPRRPTPRVSVPGTDILHSRSPMSREQLRDSSRVARGGGGLPAGVVHKQVEGRPGVPQAEPRSAGVAHGQGYLEPCSESPSSSGQCQPMAEASASPVKLTKDPAARSTSSLSWDHSATQNHRRADPFSLPGTNMGPDNINMDPSAKMAECLIKRCISSPAGQEHALSKAMCNLTDGKSQPELFPAGLPDDPYALSDEIIGAEAVLNPVQGMPLVGLEVMAEESECGAAHEPPADSLAPRHLNPTNVIAAEKAAAAAAAASTTAAAGPSDETFTGGGCPRVHPGDQVMLSQGQAMPGPQLMALTASHRSLLNGLSYGAAPVTLKLGSTLTDGHLQAWQNQDQSRCIQPKSVAPQQQAWQNPTSAVAKKAACRSRFS